MAYLELYLMIFMTIFPYAFVISFITVLTFYIIWSKVIKINKDNSNRGVIDEFN